MQVMWQVIVHIYAYLSAIPLLTFAIVWIISLSLYQDRKKAFGISSDFTTFFLIGSVSAMYDQLFHSGMNGIWLVILLFLLSGGLMGSMQNHKTGEIDGRKIFRTLWRIGFLILCFFYVLFSIILIVRHIQAT